MFTGGETGRDPPSDSGKRCRLHPPELTCAIKDPEEQTNEEQADAYDYVNK